MQAVFIFLIFFFGNHLLAAEADSTVRVARVVSSDDLEAFRRSPPMMAEAQGRLMVARNVPNRLQIFDAETLKQQADLPLIPGLFQTRAEASGWVAICSGQPSGTQLTLLNLSNPANSFFSLLIDPVFNYHCMAVKPEMRKGRDRPLVWMSTGERNIMLIDPYAKDMNRFSEESQNYAPKIIEEHKGISGAAEIEVSEDKIFTMSGVWFGSSIPLILSRKNGEALIGHSMGDVSNTTLEKSYGNDVIVVPQWNSVIYLKLKDSQLESFDLDLPTEKNRQTYKVNLTRTLHVSRFGNCLAVLGIQKNRLPEWSIVQGNGFADLKEARQYRAIDDYLAMTAYQLIDENGNLFTAQPRGVSRISGMFEGLNCK